MNLYHEMFGSSDESKYSPPGSNRLRSYPYDARAKHDYVSHCDVVDSSLQSHRSRIRSNPSDCGDRNASSYVGATQEEPVCDAIQSDLENKSWITTLSEVRE